MSDFCDSCAGPYPDDWLSDHYAGHWDTCPNRKRTYRIPRPTWTLKEDFEKDTYSFVPAFDEASRKVWEIEETILTTSVVELLRSKGYTVIEPVE